VGTPASAGPRHGEPPAPKTFASSNFTRSRNTRNALRRAGGSFPGAHKPAKGPVLGGTAALPFLLRLRQA
jgi:hypothetical protein